MARQTSTSRPVQLPCASGRPKPGERAVGAAIEDAALLDGLEGLSGCACAAKIDGESRTVTNAFHDDASFSANSVTALRRGLASHSARRAMPAARNADFWPVIPSPIASASRERSGCEVKGLTLAADAAVYAGARDAVPRAARTGSAKTPWRRRRKADSSRTPAWSPPAATPKASTASSIRRSITPRPCFTRRPRIRWRIARAINMAAAARRPPKRSNTRSRAIEGEGCAGVALLPSGLAAISTALLSVAGAGDHILVTDSVYRPTRNFCDGVFKRIGVETTYYDPLIGADIAQTVQAEHARGVRRGARLAKFRDAGHSGDRQASRTTRARSC